MSPFLTIDEAAAFSRLSTRTVRRGLRSVDRPLRHYRIGRRVVIPQHDLTTWLESHRAKPRIDAPADGAVADILKRLEAGVQR